MTVHNWIANSVKNLNRVGSWTGRTHVHKHLFIAQVLGLAEVPLRFELYHFGPYARHGDHAIADMEAFGELDKEHSKAGYGPRYVTTDLSDDTLPVADATALAHVADGIKSYTASDLELIATCLWVERREGETQDIAIIDRVKEIKPKYSTSDIQDALVKSHLLASKLKPDGTALS